MCFIAKSSTATIFAAAAVALPASGASLDTTHRLPLHLVQVGIGEAMKSCRSKGFDVSVAVVNREGRLQGLLRHDNAGYHTLQSATDKAITSAAFGFDSSYWVDRSARGEPISPLLNQLPNLLLASGGVVIKIGNEVIGGLAVAGAPGGNLDEDCAKTGREAILRELNRK